MRTYVRDNQAETCLSLSRAFHDKFSTSHKNTKWPFPSIQAGQHMFADAEMEKSTMLAKGFTPI